jgi:hypothetical protein
MIPGPSARGKFLDWADSQNVKGVTPIFVVAVGLAVAGCSKNESSASPSARQGATAEANNSTVEPNASGSSTRLQPAPRSTTEPAGPATGVGAGAAASSGIGTASAEASTANESRSSEKKVVPQAGPGAQHPEVNSNGVGNAKSSVPQGPGVTR